MVALLVDVSAGGVEAAREPARENGVRAKLDKATNKVIITVYEVINPG